MRFQLEEFTPSPVFRKEIPKVGGAARPALSSADLDLEFKYSFLDEKGEIYHEYAISSDSTLQTLASYFDKLAIYRDPALLQYLLKYGVSKESFDTSLFPILRTRSPQLDLVAAQIIGFLQSRKPKTRISLLDLGCTLAEHYDLLDALLKASSENKLSALDVLSYCGIDQSPLLLSVARLLHRNTDPKHFRLVRSDGDSFDLPGENFDLTLSVGVLNHVQNPLALLTKLISLTKRASVLALWVTLDSDSFWVVNQSGLPFYFFSKKELREVSGQRPEGRFFELDFILESQDAQRRFVGDLPKGARLGCYHLVFGVDLPFSFGKKELIF